MWSQSHRQQECYANCMVNGPAVPRVIRAHDVATVFAQADWTTSRRIVFDRRPLDSTHRFISLGPMWIGPNGEDQRPPPAVRCNVLLGSIAFSTLMQKLLRLSPWRRAAMATDLWRDFPSLSINFPENSLPAVALGKGSPSFSCILIHSFTTLQSCLYTIASFFPCTPPIMRPGQVPT